MRTDFVLGFKMARHSGFSRMATMVLCAAGGVSLLLFCMEFPEAAHIVRDYGSRDDRLLLRCLTLVIAMPVCFLISAVVRLNSDARDRRVAMLRLMGLSRLRVFNVVFAEVGSFVLCGGLLGVLLHVALSEPIYRWWIEWGFVQHNPGLNIEGDVLIALVIAFGSALFTARPAARSATKSLATVREAGRPGTRQLVASGLALVGFLVTLIANYSTNTSVEGDPHDIIYVAIGMVCFGLGLAALTQMLLRVVASVLRRRQGASSVVMAARLEGDRAAFGRALGGLVLSTFIVSTGLCVFTAWKSTPQYASTAWAVHHETSNLIAPESGPLNAMLAKARSTPGIASADEIYFDTDIKDGRPVAVLSCAQLERFVELEGCTDDAVWTYSSEPSQPGAQKTVTVTIAGRSHPFIPTKTVLASIPGGPNMWGLSYMRDGGVVVPPKIAASLGLKPNSLLVAVAPGVRSGMGVTVEDQVASIADWDNYATVNRLQTFVFILAGAVMLLGAVTVVVATLDLLAARRRRVAALQVIGLSAAMLRRTQWGAMALPVLIGIVVAVAAGMLTGRGYLSFGGYPESMPWDQLGGLLGIGITAGLLLALATGIGMGRSLTAADLRRE